MISWEAPFPVVHKVFEKIELSVTVNIHVFLEIPQLYMRVIIHFCTLLLLTITSIHILLLLLDIIGAHVFRFLWWINFQNIRVWIVVFTSTLFSIVYPVVVPASLMTDEYISYIFPWILSRLDTTLQKTWVDFLISTMYLLPISLTYCAFH
ncbi:hypothetical protein BJV82DRAFT_641551 [Fennellomyces sp. T-0311]|nr:hypothetical protein BJV82DRAFT_641551 [Fennellomyces sp. T-0311]